MRRLERLYSSLSCIAPDSPDNQFGIGKDGEPAYAYVRSRRQGLGDPASHREAAARNAVAGAKERALRGAVDGTGAVQHAGSLVRWFAGSLVRCFSGLSMDYAVWVPTLFTKNRKRLTEHDAIIAFFTRW